MFAYDVKRAIKKGVDEVERVVDLWVKANDLKLDEIKVVDLKKVGKVEINGVVFEYKDGKVYVHPKRKPVVNIRVKVKWGKGFVVKLLTFIVCIIAYSYGILSLLNVLGSIPKTWADVILGFGMGTTYLAMLIYMIYKDRKSGD